VGCGLCVADSVVRVGSDEGPLAFDTFDTLGTLDILWLASSLLSLTIILSFLVFLGIGFEYTIFELVKAS